MTWKLEKLGHKNIVLFWGDGYGLLLQICLQKTCHLLLICSFFSLDSCKAALQVKGDTKAVRQGTDSSLTGRCVGNPSFLSSFTPAACRHSCFQAVKPVKSVHLQVAPCFSFLALTSPPSTKSLHPVTSVLQVGVTGRQRDRRAERQVHRRSDSHLPEDFLWWVFLISIQAVFYNLREARAYCKKKLRTDIDKKK